MINIPLATLKRMIALFRGELDLNLLALIKDLRQLSDFVGDLIELWNENLSESPAEIPLVYQGHSYDTSAWYLDDLLDDLFHQTPPGDRDEITNQLEELVKTGEADTLHAGPAGTYSSSSINPATILLMVQAIALLMKFLRKKKAD